MKKLALLISKLYNAIVKAFREDENSEWHDGCPPRHVPISYIQQGMRLSDDGKGVVFTWRYNKEYYKNLY